MQSPVALRTGAELRKVVRAPPVRLRHLADPRRVPRPRSPTAAAARSLDAEDDVVLKGSDVFLHYPDGVQGARLTGALLERRLGVPATIRNWRTVTRLAELAGSA